MKRVDATLLEIIDLLEFAKPFIVSGAYWFSSAVACTYAENPTKFSLEEIFVIVRWLHANFAWEPDQCPDALFYAVPSHSIKEQSLEPARSRFLPELFAVSKSLAQEKQAGEKYLGLVGFGLLNLYSVLLRHYCTRA